MSLKWLNISVKDILRDTGLIFMMSYFSGFIIGYLKLLDVPGLLMIVSYAAAFICFLYIIRWKEKNVFTHIVFVAGSIWLLNAIDMLLPGYWYEWIFSGCLIFSAAFVALGLSGFCKKGQ